MRRIILFILILVTAGCSGRSALATEKVSKAARAETPTVTCTTTATSTAVPSKTPEPTATATATTTLEHTNTPEPTATERVELLPNPDGRLNCPGSVSLMYHHVIPLPLAGAKETTDLGSFAQVMSYLTENGHYFPTPAEFAQDITSGVCAHKYAIVIIDDTWNDPEGMRLLQVLSDIGGAKDIPGSPKLWLAVVTRMVGQYSNNGESMDGWIHLKDQLDTGLMYVISHSQTHPAELVNNADFNSEENYPVFSQIAGELGPSRQDILSLLGVEPYFFVYPGGNVTGMISGNLSMNGYSGAFTVTPGGLDGAWPYLLPRINGGYGCGGVEGNPDCVIEKIKSFSGN